MWRLKEFFAHKYTGGGIKQIQRLPPHEAVYRIFDYVHGRVSYNKDALDWDTSQLNRHERAFWYAWDVDCEITNGGFNQYFFNKLTRPTEPIVAAYELIGAIEHKGVFLAAVEARSFVTEAHVGVLEDAKGEPGKILEGFSETYVDNPLNQLDDEYYQIQPEINELLIGFTERNIEHFEKKK
jgi:hypothetical protein